MQGTCVGTAKESTGQSISSVISVNLIQANTWEVEIACISLYYQTANNIQLITANNTANNTANTANTC